MNFERLYTTALDLDLNSADSNVLYTSTRRQQAINDAQMEFADLTECLTRRSSVTVSCNTAEYDLCSSAVMGDGSTRFSRIAKEGVSYRVRSSGNARWVSYLTGPDFPQVPVVARNLDTPGWPQSTSVGTPSGYYIRHDASHFYLGLDTPPDVGSSEAAELIISYVAHPLPMASSGQEPFRDDGLHGDLRPYHQALVHFAAYRLLPLVGDVQGAQMQLQKFMGYVTRYLQQSDQKGPKTVRLGYNYLRSARRGRMSAVPANQWD
jgi:hypothetical protein